VATPCTAPFLGAALGFAFSQSPLIIWAIFSITGLGLGLPFLLLGFWPGVINRLPKPGAWMNTFKEMMGFLLLGTTVYLFTTFAQLAPAALNGAMWWMLFLAFAAWLLGKARSPLSSRAFRVLGQIAALVVVLISGFGLVDLRNTGSNPVSGSNTAVSTGEAGETIPFVEEEILTLIADDEPVFLEFTASWCTTCKVNQRVFKDDKVRELMTAKGVTHVKGDLTAYDETMTRWLADFGRAGVPLYVLYRPGEEPHIFPELITVEGFTNELIKIQ
jgi:thiol:disulfide interchange protein DsbD